jgi:phosphomannomutase
MLSGNETGVLLADDALRHAPSAGRRKLVVTTLVSSTLLSRMARDRGAAYAETLTGFKWIAQAARAGEVAGQAFVFGYEEALGYTAGTLVADKDGIGAAVRLAELARHLKAQGSGLLERLDGLLVEHGLSHQVQWSLTLSGAEGRRRLETIMAGLRSDPPAEVGGSPVVRAVDLLAGRDGLRADVLVFHTAEGGRLIARPSGTEPKIKFYLELPGRAAAPGEVAAVRAALEERCAAEKVRLLARLARQKGEAS